VNAAELVAQLVTLIASAAGVYAAIRADLARLHEKSQRALEEAHRANARLDELFNRGRSR
jgi:outer membrane murein-binding lipoprotein Lpp